MTDVIDKASDLEEMQRVAAIKAITTRPDMPYNGRCNNCDEPIEQGRYCSSECAEDASKRQAFNR